MPRAIRNPNSYNAIHKWLVQDYGHPVACEKCGREGIKSGRRWNIMWALISGKEYERVRENFFGLCSPCHRAYDDTPVWRARISEAAKRRDFTGFISPNRGRKRPDVSERNRILKRKPL